MFGKIIFWEKLIENYKTVKLSKLSILDRYILKKYISTFLFAMLILSLIAVVFDISERIEKFLNAKVTVWEIVTKYYLNFIPWINSLLFPIYALITVIFFTSRMASQTEIIPMFSSGISYKRFLRPYIIAGLLFTFLHLLGNHFIVPRGNKIFREFENKYIRASSYKAKDKNVHFFVGEGVKVYIAYFQTADSLGRDFQIEQMKDSKIRSLLSAKTIRWKSNPHIWTIEDYEIRTFTDSTESLQVYKGQKLDTSINLNVSDFIYVTNQKDMMTTPQLITFINRESERGSGITRLFEVEKHRRFADPFTTLILTIIGASIASRKVRGGLGLHLAVAMILGVVFIFLSKLSLTFANNEIMPPWIAIWIPNIIFAAVSYYLFRKAQK